MNGLWHQVCGLAWNTLYDTDTGDNWGIVLLAALQTSEPKPQHTRLRHFSNNSPSKRTFPSKRDASSETHTEIPTKSTSKAPHNSHTKPRTQSETPSTSQSQTKIPSPQKPKQPADPVTPFPATYRDEKALFAIGNNRTSTSNQSLSEPQRCGETRTHLKTL